MFVTLNVVFQSNFAASPGIGWKNSNQNYTLI